MQPGCQSTIHRYCEAEVVKLMHLRFIYVNYLNANGDFIWCPRTGVNVLKILASYTLNKIVFSFKY